MASLPMVLHAIALAYALAMAPLTQVQPARPPILQLRSGGDPSTSAWWLDARAERWGRIVKHHRWEMERPGSLLWCHPGPDCDTRGEGAAREALREAWDVDPDRSTTGLLAGLLELEALSDGERARLLREGSEDAQVEVLRRTRWSATTDPVPALIQAFEHAESGQVRAAAIHGLAWVMEAADPDGVRAAGRDLLLGALEDAESGADVRLAILRALGTVARLEPLGESEVRLGEARSELLRQLLGCSRGGTAREDAAAHEAIFSVLATHRRWALEAPVCAELEAVLTQRVQGAVNQAAYGTALVQLARFYAVTVRRATLELGEAPESLARSESSFWSLVDGLTLHLAQMEAGHGDWAAVATVALLEDLAATGLSVQALVPLTLELIGYLRRSAEAKALTPALARCFSFGFGYVELLWEWVEAASDPGERGRRARSAMEGDPWAGLERGRAALTGVEHEAAFWRTGAAAVAVMESRQWKSEHPLVRALRLGREQSWTDDAVLPIVDALGMCATDEAAAALLQLLASEEPGAVLHERAAWALGRIFEEGRHGWMERPMSSDLYPQGD